MASIFIARHRDTEMLWLRMLRVALNLSWPYVFFPWRSPIVRWRIETYGFVNRNGQLLRADELTPFGFFRFVFQNRRVLMRFLR